MTHLRSAEQSAPDGGRATAGPRHAGKRPPSVIRRTSGIALVTTLLITTVAFILAVTLAVSALNESRSTRSNVQTEFAIQLADAGTERARRQIIEQFDQTYLSISNFLNALGQASLPGLSGVHTVDIDGNPVHWRIVDVSDPLATFGWIDVAATADMNNAAVQTVIRRIGFGASSTFNLAMLSERTDCMFCHLRVNGDVGNLVFMRPGWGNEGHSGHGSGGDGSGLGVSRINGNVFAAQDVTRDVTSGNRLNGAEVTGIIERYSTNSALPDDINGDGIPDFPPIDREVAMLNALGRIGGGVRSCVVPIGDSFSGSCSTTTLSGTISGNLILEGTRDNPIVIDGDVWVDGDVIIKGYVSGIGGLYSGRNIYFAGDVQGVNPAYRIDDNGRCVDQAGTVVLSTSQIEATGFSPNDACARRSVVDGTDTLRVGARGSVIIGDYTEYAADGTTPMPFAQRQSAEFYRQQFGIGHGSRRLFDLRNGDELRCVDNTCRNADNVVVPPQYRTRVDAYDGAIRPGRVSASGFRSWISDEAYRQILGTEEFTYNSWRWEFSSADLSGEGLADSVHGLVGSGFPLAVALEIVDRRVDFDAMPNGHWNQFRTRLTELGYSDIPSSKGDLERHEERGGAWEVRDSSEAEARYHWSGNSLRVVHTGERTYETQVNRIDAFLYANQRIAGKTSMQAMSINGGLVARDLGILAPGRALENWTFGTSFANRVNGQRSTACSDPSSEFYVYGSEDCALTVNYDHRLRNGGYGFNIIEGRVGITLDWRVADRPQDRVAP